MVRSLFVYTVNVCADVVHALIFQNERATLEKKKADELVLLLAEQRKVCFLSFVSSW